MGFNRVGSFVDAVDSGQSRIFGWRKSFVAATPGPQWMDVSMIPGNPVPNYYASTPLVAAVLSAADGIFHGASVAPATKYLKKLLCIETNSNVPVNAILCDYLLYYPFIDESINDVQALTNIVTLPRYTDGAGVQAIAVCVAVGTGAAATAQLNYTNSAGVSGRLSSIFTVGSAGSQALTQLLNTPNATPVVSAFGPFIPLQAGDKGIRSIESVTMISGTDVGLMTLVLVKPLASFQMREITAPVEKDYFTDCPSLPVIQEGAYLNFLANLPSSIAGSTWLGLIEIAWG